MIKIILGFFLILIVLSLFVWFKFPKLIQPLVSPLFSRITNTGEVLKDSRRETVQEKSNNLLVDAKVSAEQSSKDAIDNMKDKAYDAVKSTLDIVFNKQPSNDQSVRVNVLGDSTDSTEKNSFDIPLNATTNLNLKLQKNTDYFLKFQNVPGNFCLYINDSKYPLEDGKAVKIRFATSGKYSIKANSCDLGDKVLGEFTVE